MVLVYLIVAIGLINTGTDPRLVLMIVIPLGIFLAFNALITLFISNNINDGEPKSVLPKKKKKNKEEAPRVVKSKYHIGQRIKLVDYITIEGHTFSKDATGTIIKENTYGIYMVEFDEERGKKYPVEEKYIKSLSD